MFRSLIALLIVVASPFAYAVRVPSIYAAEVPIPSESDDDKLQAEQDALAVVFVKVSGNSHLLENNPNLKTSLARADSLVEEYSYTAPDDDAPKGTPETFFVRFDADGVNRVLREAGSPVWSEIRPLILVWLALETPGQAADIVDPTSSDIPGLLKKTAKLRGLPVIFPMMDVTDLSQLSATDITNGAIPTLLHASRRYASNAMLVGKIKQDATDYISHWTLVLGNERWMWDVTGASVDDVLTNMVDNVTDALASRYGMVAPTLVKSQLTLVVQGVAEPGKLIQLMQDLHHLAPVTEVQLMNVAGTTVTLLVGLHSSKEAFLQALANTKILTAVQLPLPTKPAEGVVDYKLAQS